ncbi:hypothetical protein CC1G_15761 [Coprinopsis cinerea okayama7|uniref:PLC-like phosphodiesterase n=1 Tax=Coprinopsis cinerea (strain Okayama-7 / 130 / ATCC MYA-4618 / FGSC 9003) TaxID=240176 RepID=D6RQX5_COPC7|nr:hypothetical protein CC1G_15761 [Coprinopsis cinerea okayama7\|eukprot:XP_002910042.1 hypothetical protein CC1G_15761 [Coprinopsis cinerea okayama7\
MSLVALFAVSLLLFSQIVGLASAGPVPVRPSIAMRERSLVGGAEERVNVVERMGGVMDEVVQRQSSDEKACNGHPELCDRKYGNVTFLGSHDSFADSPHFYALSRTQEVPLEAQMKMGVRMLQAQSHMKNGVLHFCHTSCALFDGGSVEAYLLKVKKFLEENPNEVMTFVFTNPEELSVEEVWKPVFEKTGMDQLAYIPPQPIMTRDDWPTLREMIDSGRRVVVFLDKGAEKPAEPEKEYILPQFQMMWEDPHNPTDASFPCKVDRTAGPLMPTQQLYLINHNLNIDLFPFTKSGFRLPDRLNSPRTNGLQSIVHHAYQCAAEVMEDRNPNFVMLDFVNVGWGMKAVELLNGF